MILETSVQPRVLSSWTSDFLSQEQTDRFVNA
jgi:hypothetical protein